MAGLDEICSGIAANLWTLRPEVVKQVHPFILENPTAPSLMVGEPVEFSYETFSGPDNPPGMRWLIPVEAYLGTASDIAARQTLRRLLAPTGETSLVAAVEAEGTPQSRLTSRLDHSFELLEDQAPAADSIAFEEFRGWSRVLGENGATYLNAVWVFEVYS